MAKRSAAAAPQSPRWNALRTKPGIATLKCGTSATGWLTEDSAFVSSNPKTLQLMVIAENEGEPEVQVGRTTPKGHFYLIGVWAKVYPGPQQYGSRSNCPPRTCPRSTSPSQTRRRQSRSPPPTRPGADHRSSQTCGETGPHREQETTPDSATATGRPGRKSRVT